LPWRGPNYDGEFPSLGWGVEEWARKYLRVPDGPYAGDPLTLTDEQLAILVRFYALDDRGRFMWRRAAVRRAQGWGKSPLLALIALAELAGPSKFGGWDAAGEPVGRRPSAPWVQVAAVSEDQTDNTYAAAYTMAQESELNGSLVDVGLTRMFLKGEPGRLEPVTASAGTRLGQRITFAVLDETHLWTPRNGGVKLAATIRRNAGKMNGRTFESTNAHLPGEESVAERTWKAAQQNAAGLLYDSVEAPEVDDLVDRAKVTEALKVAYGDSTWVDLARIADEIADPGTDEDDARRFYFNQLVAGSDRAVDIRVWEDLTDAVRVVADGEHVGLGFDGSISDDATALYGCTADGHIFEVAVWERPPNVTDWRVPRLEVHATVRDAFARWKVGRMLCDPPKWWSEIEGWTVEFGTDAEGDPRVMMLDTNQARRFAPACDRFVTAVRERVLSHDGRPGLTAHLAATAKRKVRQMDDVEDGRTAFVFVKADTRKIDRTVGAVLAFQAAATMTEPSVSSTYEGRGLVTL
jgi:hypothetical protein